jgi:hypothetical protein
VIKIKKIVMSFILMLAIVFPHNILSFSTGLDEVDLTGKRVLFLSSYSPSFETFFKQVEGLKSIIDENKVTLDIEFMDSKRFYTEENLTNFYVALKYKIENMDPYDVIIVGDDNALDFAVENRELFPEVPIVFLGINDIDKAKILSLDSNIVGIYESVSLAGCIWLIRNTVNGNQKIQLIN